MTAPLQGEHFHVVSVGWDFDLIGRMLNHVEKSTGIGFSHILHPSIDRRSLGARVNAGAYYCFRDDVRMEMPAPDRTLLSSLERSGVPTIHNMILSDRILREIDYGDVLGYATLLAQRMLELFELLRPSLILGSFDSFHQGVALAVARKQGIPFVAMNFSAIPSGYCSFCSSLTPGSRINLGLMSDDERRMIAAKTLTAFEQRAIKAPAFVSARQLGDVVQRVPAHVRATFLSLKRIARSGTDKFNHFPIARLCRQYVRKRKNLISLPTRWFVKEAPSTPYLFFGLHMQPESSIDVWAPFYSNQSHVIEMIARSMPPSHQLLVKIHKSDADNYSREQLQSLRRLPGVRLVSPFVDSRTFIDGARLVLAIQGTIGLEAALLGKPVIMFGDSPFVEFPSVSRVGRLPDLPDLVAEKLSEERPDREEILRSYTRFLSPMGPASDNDWTLEIPISALDGYVNLFRALREHMGKDDAEGSVKTERGKEK